MSFYSGSGDSGETFTLSGQKVPKSDELIHLVGTADELYSHLGLVRALITDEEKRQFIVDIQRNIMKLMSHVSDVSNDKYFFSGSELKTLEEEIDKLSAELPKQTLFILPGSNIPEAQIHIARTVARRLERVFFAVNKQLLLCKTAGAYLNRLSDYLFVLSQQAFRL